MSCVNGTRNGTRHSEWNLELNSKWNYSRDETRKRTREREGKTRTELCFLHKEHDKLNLLTLIRRIISFLKKWGVSRHSSIDSVTHSLQCVTVVVFFNTSLSWCASHSEYLLKQLFVWNKIIIIITVNSVYKFWKRVPELLLNCTTDK